MKYCLSILFAMNMLAVGACSEESPIEGLMPVKASVAAIHAEIPAGSNKTVSFTIKNKMMQLEVKNTRLSNATIETKHCTMTLQNGAGVFPVTASTTFIQAREAGAEISAAVFGYPSATGFLYYTTSPINSADYHYENNNGIQFGKHYFIPMRISAGNNADVPVYAYLECSVAADKLILHKVVYKNEGSISAGAEK